MFKFWHSYSHTEDTAEEMAAPRGQGVTPRTAGLPPRGMRYRCKRGVSYLDLS